MTIAVVLCTCDGAAHLPRLLKSLLAQQRPPDEVVIRDDRSTDDSVELARAFAGRAPFPVKVHVNDERLGVTRNFAAGFEAATCDVICPCDQDDVWYPEKLARVEASFVSEPALDLVFSDADLVDEDLAPLGRTLWESIGFSSKDQRDAATGRLWAVLAKYNVVTGITMAFASRQREVLLPIPADWLHDGWVGAILSAAGNCRIIDDRLLAYRQHGLQQIGGGPVTIASQAAVARRMDVDYFDRLADRFSAAVDRLKTTRAAPEAVRLFEQKSAHCRRRAALRRGTIGRVDCVLSELAAGGYARCALGWKSVAQDLFLARVEDGTRQ